MLPTMSLLTGLKATEPSLSVLLSIHISVMCHLDELDEPKSVVRDSAASRKSLVGMALSFWASTATSTKDLWSVSNQVPPAG